MKIRKQSLSQKVFAAALIILCIGLAGTTALAQVDKWGAWENGITEAWSLSSRTFTNEDFANAVNRWKLIGEISSPGWEGDYFSGSEVHGTYVRWSPQAGFIIANVDKCQALVMSVTYGRVNVTPSTIQFIPEFSKSSKSDGHHGQKRDHDTLNLIPVKWRDSLFLIPEKEIRDFVDYVAGLGNFNALNGFDPGIFESHFYAKYAGKVVTTDTPVLPDEYKNLVKTPITGRITTVLDRKLKRNYSYDFPSEFLSFEDQHELASLTFVTVNIGAAHGAKKDLFLRVIKPDLGEIVRLIEVGPTSSKAVLVRGIEKNKETYYDHTARRERKYPRVAAGWTLTTALRP